MSKVRNAPGYRFKPRTRRLSIRYYPGNAEGFHSPALTLAEKAAMRAAVHADEA